MEPKMKDLNVDFLFQAVLKLESMALEESEDLYSGLRLRLLIDLRSVQLMIRLSVRSIWRIC